MSEITRKIFLFCSFLLIVVFVGCNKKSDSYAPPIDITKPDSAFYYKNVSPGCADTLFRFGIPNAFTPNGDGINDNFLVVGLGIGSVSLNVWDLNDTLVYFCTSQYLYWNGINSTGQCVPGFYKVRVMVKNVSGSITISHSMYIGLYIPTDCGLPTEARTFKFPDMLDPMFGFGNYTTERFCN